MAFASQTVQLKSDLSRTRLAEQARIARKANSRRRLQTGGILIAGEARKAVLDREKAEKDKLERRLTSIQRRLVAAEKRQEKKKKQQTDEP